MNRPIIYGIITYADQTGVQAFALSLDKKVFEIHFSSNDEWAKSDLGFSNTSIGLNDERKRIYRDTYPEGHELVWLGESWVNHESAEEIDQILRLKAEEGEVNQLNGIDTMPEIFDESHNLNKNDFIKLKEESFGSNANI